MLKGVADRLDRDDVESIGDAHDALHYSADRIDQLRALLQEIAALKRYKSMRYGPDPTKELSWHSLNINPSKALMARIDEALKG
jgi:hypothetical protein